jgi:hypothetical protein
MLSSAIAAARKLREQKERASAETSTSKGRGGEEIPKAASNSSKGEEKDGAQLPKGTCASDVPSTSSSTEDPQNQPGQGVSGDEPVEIEVISIHGSEDGEGQSAAGEQKKRAEGPEESGDEEPSAAGEQKKREEGPEESGDEEVGAGEQPRTLKDWVKLAKELADFKTSNGDSALELPNTILRKITTEFHGSAKFQVANVWGLKESFLRNRRKWACVRGLEKPGASLRLSEALQKQDWMQPEAAGEDESASISALLLLALVPELRKASAFENAEVTATAKGGFAIEFFGKYGNDMHFVTLLLTPPTPQGFEGQEWALERRSWEVEFNCGKDLSRYLVPNPERPLCASDRFGDVVLVRGSDGRAEGLLAFLSDAIATIFHKKGNDPNECFGLDFNTILGCVCRGGKYPSFDERPEPLKFDGLMGNKKVMSLASMVDQEVQGYSPEALALSVLQLLRQVIKKTLIVCREAWVFLDGDGQFHLYVPAAAERKASFRPKALSFYIQISALAKEESPEFANSLRVCSDFVGGMKGVMESGIERGPVAVLEDMKMLLPEKMAYQATFSEKAKKDLMDLIAQAEESEAKEGDVQSKKMKCQKEEEEGEGDVQSKKMKCQKEEEEEESCSTHKRARSPSSEERRVTRRLAHSEQKKRKGGPKAVSPHHEAPKALHDTLGNYLDLNLRVQGMGQEEHEQFIGHLTTAKLALEKACRGPL